MRNRVLFSMGSAALMAAGFFSGCAATNGDRPVTKHISGAFHYVDGYAPISGNDITVVIEIPAGTTQKWEVNKTDGNLHWEIRDGKPRIVKYLGYPGNYGMVPRTLLAYENGGDGDPLDVLVLGPPADRGDVVKAKLIGVLKLVDGGEQDDKLIAVLPGTVFYDLDSVEDLNEAFPGMLDIVETWFESYKGAGKLQSLGYKGADDAAAILNQAVDTYASKKTAPEN